MNILAWCAFLGGGYQLDDHAIGIGEVNRLTATGVATVTVSDGAHLLGPML